MRFDINELRKYIEKGDLEKLLSLAYRYQSCITYLREEEYAELNNLLKFILDYIYDIEQQDIQEAFFDVIKKAININFGKSRKFREVIDLVIDKIESINMTSWELAESLLVISSTMDRDYSDIMSKYIEHENNYVREVVKEYFLDMSF